MVKKLTIKESIDLNDYTYKFSKQGYKLYFKMVNNKAQWVAVGEDGIPFEVSYEAVRGFEPINPADARLQKKVAKALKLEVQEPFTSEETGSYTAQDSKEAAKQVFENAYSLYNKTGATISEFQMDVELDTNKFWDTLASLCSNNGFEYVIVSEDENFDDRYYTIKLIDIEEGYDVENECITEDIEDFDQYVGCGATFDGNIDDIKFYFTNKEFKEIRDYIGSDGDIIDLGGPNDCCGVIRFSDGATFTVPFDFLEIYE